MTKITADLGKVIEITFKRIILEKGHDYVQVRANSKDFDGLRDNLLVLASCKHDHDHQQATNNQQSLHPGLLGAIVVCLKSKI